MRIVLAALFALVVIDIIWRILKEEDEPEITGDPFYDQILRESNAKERWRRIDALKKDEAVHMLKKTSDYINKQIEENKWWQKK